MRGGMESDWVVSMVDVCVSDDKLTCAIRVERNTERRKNEMDRRRARG